MKQNSIPILFLALLIAALNTHASPSDSLRILSAEGRIHNLELLESNLKADLELKKRALEASVYQTDTYIWIGILVGIIGIFGGWLAIWRARTQAVKMAEDLIAVEVAKKIPESTNRKLKELLSIVSPYDLEAILDWAKSQLRQRQILAEAKVSVLVDSEAAMKEAVEEVKSFGFKQVSGVVADAEKLPEGDLVLFFRKEPKPDQGWTKLDDAVVKRILDQNRDKGMQSFFYYGPRNESLDPKMHPRLAFANMATTAPMHILTLLGKYMTLD
jgi:hypothetical protein